MSFATHWREGLLATALLVVASGAAASPFGINGHIPGPEIVDAIADAGISWVRIDMVWSFIEPEPDVFDWSLYDQTIAGLTARGLRIFATLQGTPAWATAGSEFNGVPSDAARWRRFCYRAAARYSGRVDAWGIWNEPNLSRFWEGTRTQYLHVILIPGIDAIRLADPAAFVVGPNLAHLTSASWDSWLRAVISAAGDRLDALAHHVYPSDGRAANVTRKLETGSSYPWEPPSVRRVLQSSGWWGRPFWLAETGVESGRYSEAGQERFYEDLLLEWFGPARRRDWVDRVFFYEISDDPNVGSTFGIVGPLPLLERKPAYFAYRNRIAAARLDDAGLEAWPAELVVPSSGRTTFAIIWRNTGATSWRSTDGYRIAAEVGGTGWTISGGDVPPDRTVHPGSSVTVSFELVAPPLEPQLDPTRVQVLARPERTGVGRFGDAANFAVLHSGGALPSATATPRTIVLSKGSDARMAISPGEEGAILRWHCDGAPLRDGSRVRGAFTAELVISAVDAGDDGDYHCLVSNRTGERAFFAGRIRVIPVTPEAGEPRRLDAVRLKASTVERWRQWRFPAAAGTTLTPILR